MDILLDSGTMFGMGAFETIAVYNSKAILLEEHIERLGAGLQYLQIDKKIKSKDIEKFIIDNKIKNGVVKIMVSEKNTIITTRENPYTKEMYEKGFSLQISKIKRNETSPLTYLKTFNYSDNILEREKAIKGNYNDAMFVNSKDFICETSCSNIFFVRKEQIYTPVMHSGLLPGVVRSYVIKRYEVIEKEIHISELVDYEEVFITNSLLGVMPIYKIDNQTFLKNNIGKKIRTEYQKYVDVEKM